MDKETFWKLHAQVQNLQCRLDEISPEYEETEPFVPCSNTRCDRQGPKHGGPCKRCKRKRNERLAINQLLSDELYYNDI